MAGSSSPDRSEDHPGQWLRVLGSVLGFWGLGLLKVSRAYGGLGCKVCLHATWFLHRYFGASLPSIWVLGALEESGFGCGGLKGLVLRGL